MANKLKAFTLIEMLVCTILIVGVVLASVMIMKFTLTEQYAAHATETNELELRRASLEIENSLQNAGTFRITDDIALPPRNEGSGNILKIVDRGTIPLGVGNPIYFVHEFVFTKTDGSDTAEYYEGVLGIYAYYVNASGEYVNSLGTSLSTQSKGALYEYGNIKIRTGGSYNRPFTITPTATTKVKYLWYGRDKFGDTLFTGTIPFNP